MSQKENIQFKEFYETHKYTLLASSVCLYVFIKLFKLNGLLQSSNEHLDLLGIINSKFRIFGNRHIALRGFRRDQINIRERPLQADGNVIWIHNLVCLFEEWVFAQPNDVKIHPNIEQIMHPYPTLFIDTFLAK